jgi:hypothetical protein
MDQEDDDRKAPRNIHIWAPIWDQPNEPEEGSEDSEEAPKSHEVAGFFQVGGTTARELFSYLKTYVFQYPTTFVLGFDKKTTLKKNPKAKLESFPKTLSDDDTVLPTGDVYYDVGDLSITLC